MMAVEESAALLGVPSIVEEYELPDRIVAIFNRDYMDGEGCSVERPEGDHKFISRLERIAKGLGIQPAKKKLLKCILEKIAGKCGMKVNVEGKTRPKIGKQRVLFAGTLKIRMRPHTPLDAKSPITGVSTICRAISGNGLPMDATSKNLNTLISLVTNSFQTTLTMLLIPCTLREQTKSLKAVAG